jgi:nucleoid-associated protein YgaU
MSVILSKEIYNSIVQQKIANERTIAELYASFDNFTQDEQFIAISMITDFNIINEEFQKYIVLYNNTIQEEVNSNEYIVSFGDTIHSIAQKETGDYENWKKIMEFNNLYDLDLEVGSIILIPSNLDV